MELGFTCNSATNGNCTQISWLVNVLTKIQSSLHFSLHSRLRAFPVMCLPGFIPIWETEISRVRMFPENTFPTSYISLFVLVSAFIISREKENRTRHKDCKCAISWVRIFFQKRRFEWVLQCFPVKKLSFPDCWCKLCWKIASMEKRSEDPSAARRDQQLADRHAGNPLYFIFRTSIDVE